MPTGPSGGSRGRAVRGDRGAGRPPPRRGILRLYSAPGLVGDAGGHRSAVGGLEIPFVGRSEEFGILVEEYHSARGSARAVAVAGEAGIGKTRLVEQFLRWTLAEGAD